MSIKSKLEDILAKHPVWSGIVAGGVTAALAIPDFIVDAMRYGSEYWQDPMDIALHFGLPTTIGLLTAYVGKELKQVRNIKKIEAILKETLEFNKKIIFESPIGIAVYDKSGQCIETNDSFGELIGTTREQVLKQNYNNIKSWERTDLLNKAKSAIKNNEKIRCEMKAISTFGKDMILYCYLVPFGQRALLLMIDDIKERKKIEKALQESEEKHKTLLKNIPQKIFFKDINSVYISCNENYARDLKIKANEIFGKNDFDFYSKELAEKYRGDDKRIIKIGKTENIEEKYIQDGKELIVNTVKTPVRDENQNVIGLLGIFWDITERKKIEEQREELLYDYGERVKELTGLYSLGRLATETNKLEDLLREFTRNIVPPSMQFSGKTIARVELNGKMYGIDKKEFACQLSAHIVIKSEQRGTLSIGYTEELPFVSEFEQKLVDGYAERLGKIIERKEAEEKLRLTQFSLDNASDATFWINSDAKILYANKTACERLGYSLEEMLTKNVYDFNLDFPKEKWPAHWKELEQKKRMNFESQNIAKDGRTFPIEVTVNYLEFEGKKYIFSFTKDITERKKMEETIDRMHKEQEIYLRHEFGNIHNIISCNADLVLRYNDKTNNLTEDQKEFIHGIRRTTKRAINLINSLKQIQEFERGNYNINKIDCDLNSLVEPSVNNFKVSETKHDVEIDYNNNSNNSEMKLDPYLMSCVFDNLIKNAVEHVSKLKDKAEKYVKVDMYNENDKLFVKINNKGKEIPSDRLKTFFEKFNSTKTDGTGIGTTIAYQITKAHGGDICVDSNKQDGTTVTLEFRVS